MIEQFPFKSAQVLLDLAIAEDIGSGDVSSLWTISDLKQNQAHIVAKEDGILCGTPLAQMIFDAITPIGQKVDFEWHKKEGAHFKKGEVLLTMEGSTQVLLSAERTLLNFVQQLSGVATLTYAFCSELLGTQTRLLDTRKTIPGWRLLQKYAVLVGGGCNHRIGLYDMVMMKENHIAGAGGITLGVQKVLAHKPEGMKIEVECEELEQIQECLPLPIHRIMLDNFDLEKTRQAVEMIRSSRPDLEIEASGNMTLERVRAVALTGVDFISVGALTHSVRALDLSMRFL